MIGNARLAAEVCRPSLRSEEHTSELQSLRHLVCRLLLEKKIRTLPSAAQPLPCPLRRLSRPAAAARVSPLPWRLIPVDVPQRLAPPRQMRRPSLRSPAAD